MAKVQDTYNPVTGEYVKRISDYVDVDGKYNWTLHSIRAVGYKTLVNWGTISDSNAYGNILMKRYDSRIIPNIVYTNKEAVYITSKYPILTLPITEFGIPDNVDPTASEIKAYFHGWKMANADGTSPYYKSEVPYNPTTWNEWTGSKTSGAVADSTGVTITGDGAIAQFFTSSVTNIKASTNYGILFNVPNSNIVNRLYFGTVAYSEPFAGRSLSPVVGNNKVIFASQASFGANQIKLYLPIEAVGKSIKLKDIRIFELPTGSQIEADFTNLTADQLSAKYTFNGLCLKNWKKVTDGTGLTSTLPTATYAGYTPYKMIYQLATPEISYLTPKTAIPLYDTNTIVETNTLADCKADVTVGYKLKSGATAVAGDITAPTPDYMSTVNSVSEDGLKKGIVRSPNMVTNGNFANGVTGWKGEGGTLSSADLDTSTYISAPSSLKIATSGSWIRRYQSATVSNGKKYYISAHVKSTPVTGGYRFAYAYGTTLGNYPSAFLINGSTTTSTPWTKISTVFTATQSSNIVYGITTYMNSGESINLDDVSLIDLTASFGAGNEPTKEQCDILFATWQDKASTQATLPTLRKIGTVADTYNPETGVLVQRIGKKVFDGTETWIISSPTHYISLGNYKTTATTSDVSCSHYKSAEFSTSNLKANSFSIGGTIGAKNGNFYTDVKGMNLTQWKEYLAQQYANGTPVTVYYQLATPVITTLTKTALPTYKPTTVIESDSTIKGSVSADYKLKANATPVARDFIASPECVNDIKDLGNSIDVVSSVGARNLIPNSMFADTNSDGEADGFQKVGNFTRCIQSIDTINTHVSPRSQKLVKNTADGVGLAHTTKGIVGNKYFFRGYNKAVGGSGCKMNIGHMYPHSSDYYSKTVNATNEWVEGYKVFTAIKENIYVNNFPIADTAWANGWYLVDLTSTFGAGKEPTEQWCIDNLTWKPAPEETPYNTATNGVYKTNILLSAPLRSVGAVKDRLFKDSDGKWKIERNIGEVILNGAFGWNLAGELASVNGLTVYNNALAGVKVASPINCDKLRTLLVGYDDTSVSSPITNAVFVQSNGMLVLNIGIEKLTERTVAAIRNYLTANPITIQYQLVTPTYETLSQELQTKLDNIPTFPEHNYVYTVTNDNLQPTLHVDYKKLSWLKSRLLFNTLKIYNRNLTDDEMIQNYKIEKDRFGM